MERINIRTQSLLTQMVAHTLRADLSANETKRACVVPSRPRPACRLNRPDTYQRLPESRKFSLAISSRSIHLGHKRKSAEATGMSAPGGKADFDFGRPGGYPVHAASGVPTPTMAAGASSCSGGCPRAVRGGSCASWRKCPSGIGIPGHDHTRDLCHKSPLLRREVRVGLRLHLENRIAIGSLEAGPVPHLPAHGSRDATSSSV